MTYGVVFVMLLMSGIIATICWWGTYKNNLDERPMNTFMGGIITFCVMSFFMFALTPWISYINYMNLVEYKSGKYEQYADAVQEYNRIISQQRGDGEITDLKFQGFQQPMMELIKDHRRALTDYNTTLVGKRVLAKNYFIGFLIIEPDDDMQVLPFIIKER